MKHLILGIVALTASQFTNAQALTFEKLAGKYMVTHPELPVQNLVTINEAGEVTLSETSSSGTLKCSGQAKLENNILSSSLKCENEVTFTQAINLSEVRDFSKFKAKVYSSLYDQEIEMDFKRL